MQNTLPGSLPELVDFLKQVEREARYAGVLSVSQLARLKASVCSESGEINANVAFSTRVGVPCLDGEVQAEIQMECQRCLEPVTVRVNGVFHFGLVSNEDEIALLPDEFEPLQLSEGEQSLIDVIEDELILSLPIVSRHDNDCSKLLKEQDDNKSDMDTYKPFAGLKDMMT